MAAVVIMNMFIQLRVLLGVLLLLERSVVGTDQNA